MKFTNHTIENCTCSMVSFVYSKPMKPCGQDSGVEGTVIGGHMYPYLQIGQGVIELAMEVHFKVA